MTEGKSLIEIDVQLERRDFRLDLALRLERPVTGVFGHSGAGKSTLLHLIAGIVRPDRGRIAVDGMVLVDRARGIDLPPHRRRVAIVFQDGRLFPHLSVESNLRYGERLAPPARRRLGFAEVVAMLELGALLARPPATLSGGERQRVALGRALLSAPRLLVLDEPLAALDRGLKRKLLPFLREVRDRAGIPMLHVSHDLGEILQLTDHLVLIDHGRVAGHGDLQRLASDPATAPLLHDLGLVNRLEARVAGHDASCTRLVLVDGDAAIIAPRRDLAVGAQATVALAPRDLALALAPVAGTGFANQIPGTVRSLTTNAGRALATVDIGRPLLVEVDTGTIAALGLEPGRAVHVLFTAGAVRHES